MVENKTNSTLTTLSPPSGPPSWRSFVNMKKDVVAKACGRFRHRLEMIVAADGGYIEK
ncbi:Transposable element tcb1 transposase [Caligus rogercresseyi]|uniref:Transposable element tcb1 transposase n=1 Tax=Caligus rogercresseyi TaxID=217165 RepID=A0A7T8GYV9_CALRO|nr:Transposable element tcb1 transposase [Caligus rogercresseyi]